MRAIFVSVDGEILGKDLVTGYQQPAMRMRGVVLDPSKPSTTRKKPTGASSDGSHDPGRRDGLLNNAGR